MVGSHELNFRAVTVRQPNVVQTAIVVNFNSWLFIERNLAQITTVVSSDSHIRLLTVG